MSKSKDDGQAQQELLDEVRRLADEIRMLRESIDELTVEIQWANRNSSADGESRTRPIRVTSMPLDPTAERFELNQVDDATVEQLRAEAGQADSEATTGAQQRLF